MIIYEEKRLSDFYFGSQASENANMLSTKQLDKIERILEDLYPDGIDSGHLNDLFRFDFDQICEWLNIDENGNEIGSYDWATEILDNEHLTEFQYSLIDDYFDYWFEDGKLDDKLDLLSDFEDYVESVNKDRITKFADKYPDLSGMFVDFFDDINLQEDLGSDEELEERIVAYFKNSDE